MNESYECAPGETLLEKSENSKLYLERTIEIYKNEWSATAERVKILISGVIPDSLTLSYPVLFHITNLTIEHTKILIIKLENAWILSKKLNLMLEALKEHQSGNDIIKPSKLIKSEKNK